MDGTGYFNHIVRAPFEHVIVQQVYDKIGLDQEQYMIQVIILSCFLNQLFVPSKHEQIDSLFSFASIFHGPLFFCAPKHSETTVRWAAGKMETPTSHENTEKSPSAHRMQP